MVVKAGDAVLVYYDLLIFDAVVLKVAEDSDGQSSGDSVKTFFIHFSGWSDNWDEWVAAENVLEDTPENRELQKEAKAALATPRREAQREEETERTVNRPVSVPGSERLVAMIGWMKTLDDSLMQLDKQVKDLVREQISQEAGAVALKKRKAEADVQKAELEVEVARDLKRVKVAEETALARKRLKDAGISQEEIDAILPAVRTTSATDLRMAVEVGDMVLVYHGPALLDAVVQEIDSGRRVAVGAGQANQLSFFVRYLAEHSKQDEWVRPDHILENTPANRKLQEEGLAAAARKSEASLTEKSEASIAQKFWGTRRENAIVAWMHLVDVSLARLDEQVAALVRDRSSQKVVEAELKRRKTAAESDKTQVEVAMMQELKRVKVAEETALARQRLRNAGISQQEIENILPVNPAVPTYVFLS
ncbi:hypothetical protein BBJ28_00004151 [Nothophytophthora sp. Chile5]|nr:hypothetical protein BBJ28_00004151 [Nothophytophthora sp. Chile5]